MARVLVSAPLPGRAIERLRREHDVEVGDDPLGLRKERLLPRVAPFDALVTTLRDRIDEEVLATAPKLKIVANCAVGVDNIDLEACARRGVVVTNTPGVLTDAVADFTFALILDACRRVTEGDRLVRAGAWTGFALTHHLGKRVTGATLGVLGMGRIGRAVAERARGFRMNVLYANRSRLDARIEAQLSARFVSLDELFAESDVLCVACPLTPETANIVSRKRVAKMKDGAVLVNTSRGGCVDELAVADALARGKLFAAGLDVYANEPSVAPELLARANVVLAPHAASADEPTRAAMADLAAAAVLAVLRGEPAENVVPPPR